MKQNIAALVAEAGKGSQAAYEALYQGTKQMVYFTCFGLLKSEADAADQMQETYITAFQKLDTLEEPEKFPAWIKRIAVNKCKDFLVQKKSWFPLFEEEDIPVEFEETDADFLPESYITVQSKRKIVQQIMQKELSDVQYRTILLYYYDELSLAEIAGLMECSEGTVKSRLHTARERIKESVLKYEEKHKDKLYSIAALPFLVQLLQREAAELQMPEIRPDFLQGIKKQKPTSGWKGDSKQNANQSQKGEKPFMGKKGILSTTAGKIIAAALVLLIVGGGLAGTLIAVSHGGQGNDSRDSGTEGNAGVSEGGDDVISENEELFCQIPFTDAATGEDYLSGHILSAIFYDYNDDYAEVYMVLDDKHNLYKCTFSSDVFDAYTENDEIQWDIELLYENARLEEIEECWHMYHYDINTGDKEPGGDGHEECTLIYGNGYVYRDGEEYDLNAILPIKKLGVEAWSVGSSIFIVDTSGNLHYWRGERGLDNLNDFHPELEQVGFLNYYEAPVCEELCQGNCVDVVESNVLLSDGRLVYAGSPLTFTAGAVVDVDSYTFEERTLMEGIESLYGRFYMAVEDGQGNIHVGGPYFPESIGEEDEIVPCDYEGEIQGIYTGRLRSLLVQTTDKYYYSGYCYDLPEGEELVPLKSLTALDSASSPIKEVVHIESIGNVEISFLLEDGTIWGYIYEMR